jgi:hypothetical protein
MECSFGGDSEELAAYVPYLINCDLREQRKRHDLVGCLFGDRDIVRWIATIGGLLVARHRVVNPRVDSSPTQ